MAKRSRIDQLERAVQAMLSRPTGTRVRPGKDLERSLAPLLRIAQNLRDLPREDFLEPIIVARRREQSAVAGQRDRRIGRAIVREAHDKFGREMRRIRGAPAVATRQDLVTRAQTVCNQVSRFRDLPVKIDQ